MFKEQYEKLVAKFGKRNVTIGAVVVGLLVVGLLNRGLSQRSYDNAAERAIEAATGGKVDVDSTKGEVTVKTDDGTFTGGNKIPDNFPADVPVYPGAIVQGAYAINGNGGQGYTVALKTNDAQTAVVAWYKREIVSKGWTVEAEMNVDKSSILSATKDERGLNVSVATDEDGVTIGLVVANK